MGLFKLLITCLFDNILFLYNKKLSVSSISGILVLYVCVIYGNDVNVLDNNLIHNAHTKNLKVHVWTINCKEKMEALIDMKVDGIMTDEANLLKSVCSESNLF